MRRPIWSVSVGSFLSLWSFKIIVHAQTDQPIIQIATPEDAGFPVITTTSGGDDGYDPLITPPSGGLTDINGTDLVDPEPHPGNTLTALMQGSLFDTGADNTTDAFFVSGEESVTGPSIIDSAAPASSPVFVPTLLPFIDPSTFIFVTDAPFSIPTPLSVTPFVPAPTSTILPSPRPVPSPVSLPVITESPTSDPTAPSIELVQIISTPQPSPLPTGGQVVLTLRPSVLASQSPSAQPSDAIISSTVDNLSSVWTNFPGPLGGELQSEWERITTSIILKYWGLANMLENLKVTTTIKDQIVHSPRKIRRLRGRSLQQDEKLWEIVYSHTVSYSGPEASFTMNQIVFFPFNSDEKRLAYVDHLKLSESLSFASIEEVSAIVFVDDQAGEADSIGEQPNPPIDNSGATQVNGTKVFFEDNMLYLIVAASVTGLLVVTSLVSWCYCRRKKRMSQNMKDHNRDAYMSGAYGPSASTANMSSGIPQDDSTLADPAPRIGVNVLSDRGGDQSVAGFGDQSVATIDYDYSKAYGGYGDRSVVSMASATIGDGTNLGTLTGANTIHGTITNTLGDNNTIFSDDVSFNPGASSEGPLREELIDVSCPPGKLGVVIDTPDDGAPVVHAIKESSCVADKLRVGDKLVAVDDEDVRAMTAIKVSKMISRKSANPIRKLTLIRGSTVGERE